MHAIERYGVLDVSCACESFHGALHERTEVPVFSAEFSRAYLNEIRDKVRIAYECEFYQSKHCDLVEEDEQKEALNVLIGLFWSSPYIRHWNFAWLGGTKWQGKLVAEEVNVQFDD
ncbi:hypothetical protein VTN00DRAFT_3442 [Thermoascus crustaceus]|uniref:uncharacterized protein n=1 Tax=Thermoascus crustaceus TaxID=5088 RepID=UPI003742D61E